MILIPLGLLSRKPRLFRRREHVTLTEYAEKEGYWFADEDMVSIRKSEIVRIWAELGDLYFADGKFPE